jgi:3-hydroxyacyl-[acyl-carrier-protein] dehydratase
MALDHPAAAGHFPGNPIIPGAVLLNEVMAAMSAAAKEGTVPLEIRSAKFLRPVRPGDLVTINWSESSGGEVRFECLVQDCRVLTGMLRVGNSAGP